jgi:hypothetical protein
MAAVTSISAYRTQHTLLSQDLGAALVADRDSLLQAHQYFFYQELNAVSNDGRIQWVGGGTSVACSKGHRSRN